MDALARALRDAISAGTGLSIDLLYGDHEGGQRVITRFYVSPRTHASASRVPAIGRVSL